MALQVTSDQSATSGALMFILLSLPLSDSHQFYCCTRGLALLVASCRVVQSTGFEVGLCAHSGCTTTKTIWQERPPALRQHHESTRRPQEKTNCENWVRGRKTERHYGWTSDWGSKDGSSKEGSGVSKVHGFKMLHLFLQRQLTQGVFDPDVRALMSVSPFGAPTFPGLGLHNGLFCLSRRCFCLLVCCSFCF